jgi:hypothetical protein
LNDTASEDTLAPGPLAQEIFYTDAAGEPGSPDDIIRDACLEDWEDLEPRALELLRDEAAKPYDRFLACTALVAWGSPDGYTAVQAAADPQSVPWLGYSVDRLYDLDDTFGLLAHSVADSRDMAAERGTQKARYDALAALAPVGLIAALEYADPEAARNDAAQLLALDPENERVRRALGTLAQ